jgi:hypothetical protein
VTRDEVRAFVNRDWDRVAEAKDATWQASKRTAAEDLHTAGKLRPHITAPQARAAR